MVALALHVFHEQSNSGLSAMVCLLLFSFLSSNYRDEVKCDLKNYAAQ